MRCPAVLICVFLLASRAGARDGVRSAEAPAPVDAAAPTGDELPRGSLETAPADASTPASADAPPALPQAVEQPAEPAPQGDDDADEQADVSTDPRELRWQTALATGGAVALLSPMPIAGFVVPDLATAGLFGASALRSPVFSLARGLCCTAGLAAPFCIPLAPAFVAWLHDQQIAWQPIAAAAVGGVLTTGTITAAGAVGLVLVGIAGLAGARDEGLRVIVGFLIAAPIISLIGSIATGYAAWATFPGVEDSRESSAGPGSCGRPSGPTRWSRASASLQPLLVERAPGNMAY